MLVGGWRVLGINGYSSAFIAQRELERNDCFVPNPDGQSFIPTVRFREVKVNSLLVKCLNIKPKQQNYFDKILDVIL